MVINPIVGVCIPIIRIPIEGGMTIPNTTSLDPGSFGHFVPSNVSRIGDEFSHIYYEVYIYRYVSIHRMGPRVAILSEVLWV